MKITKELLEDNEFFCKSIRNSIKKDVDDSMQSDFTYKDLLKLREFLNKDKN